MCGSPLLEVIIIAPSHFMTEDSKVSFPVTMASIAGVAVKPQSKQVTPYGTRASKQATFRSLPESLGSSPTAIVNSFESLHVFSVSHNKKAFAISAPLRGVKVKGCPGISDKATSSIYFFIKSPFQPFNYIPISRKFRYQAIEKYYPVLQIYSRNYLLLSVIMEKTDLGN